MMNKREVIRRLHNCLRRHAVLLKLVSELYVYIYFLTLKWWRGVQRTTRKLSRSVLAEFENLDSCCFS
ncbi:hypothetical protein T03_15387 [Trichinella britovi]|uniref:Uncharacterized protein n=1 Tax=Trichinella britovi TaxID=45882 RepID=A0A0V1DEW5_TRIBR|nr:hypothetical protein T03_15387 [Trichinella britovi]